MNIGDRVKVIGQDITGEIERIDGYSVSIIDDDSEWEYPESLLEYKLSEVEPLKRYRILASSANYFYLDIEAKDEDEAWKIAYDSDGGDYKQQGLGDWQIDSVSLIQEN